MPVEKHSVPSPVSVRTWISGEKVLFVGTIENDAGNTALNAKGKPRHHVFLQILRTYFLQLRCDAFALAVSENSIVGLCNVKSIMDLGRPPSATQRFVVESRSACEAGVHRGFG